MITPFEAPLPNDYVYHVYPHEVNALVRELDGTPELTTNTFRQYSNHIVQALTITDPRVDRSTKKALFVSRPHAHEPAGTAAILELAKALLGQGIYKETHPSWRSHILQNYVITLIPDANPFGSERAPVKFWDGSEIRNEQFFLWMFGESGEKPGERFPRLADWNLQEVTPPALLGIAYEEIEKNIYVEPNRDYRSTFFQSFFDLDPTYHYDVWLDLHQTEFINSERNTEIHLPTCHDDLPNPLKDQHYALGAAIQRRWQDSGGISSNKPKVPYRTNDIQRDFLTKVWLPISSRLIHVVTEVQNNNPRTPTPMQVYLQGVALLETLEWMDRS